MKIKFSPGQTLLTLLRVAICGVAALCIFGMHGCVDTAVDLFRHDDASGQEGSAGPGSYGNSYILYYEEPLADGESTIHVYKQYYITGQEGTLGMVDASGQVVFESRYQGIILLPHSCILKEDGLWRFYDLERQLLSDEAWDEVAIEKDEHGKISNDLVMVCRDGSYGATTQLGEIIISPRWDGLDLYSYDAGWPIIRVKSGDYYGFVDNDGDTVISVEYPYAQMGTLTTPIVNEAGEITGDSSETAVFVFRNDDWGAIFQDEDGDPTRVDWDVEPPASIIEDYQSSLAG